MTRSIHMRCWLLSLVAVALACGGACLADEIDGVQPAAIDQPRVHVIVRRNAKAAPLAGESALGGKTSSIEAFLDTGASGVMLSSHTADTLGIKRETDPAGTQAVFEDVGVGGRDKFAISEELVIATAPYIPAMDNDDKSTDAFKQTAGPLRLQIGPIGGGAGGLLEMLAGDVDVVGMPAMRGKVVVLDTGVVNSFMDTIRTYIYDPNTADHPNQRNSDPGIPKTHHHVKLSFASFKNFTTTTPATAEAPDLVENPFIGPSPVAAKDAAGVSVPPVTVALAGKSASGAWLLDTGAATSMISHKEAAELGVQYAQGTDGTNNPSLTGVGAAQQFVMTVGGVGGSRKAAGFYLATLTLKTQEGDAITFKHAPVLVSDITVEDPTTKQRLTLDGVFGMNFLVATAKIDEGGLLPDIDKLTAGAFKWVVFDQPNGVLGLEETTDAAGGHK